METDIIKNTIIENYVHGAFNETNIGAFKEIFHREFSIINVQEDGNFFLFTKDMWEQVLKKRKGDEGFDYTSIALKTSFRTIDIEGDNASVSMDLLKGDQTVYTDFLLMKKINGTWNIVSKIYLEH